MKHEAVSSHLSLFVVGGIAIVLVSVILALVIRSRSHDSPTPPGPIPPGPTPPAPIPPGPTPHGSTPHGPTPPPGPTCNGLSSGGVTPCCSGLTTNWDSMCSYPFDCSGTSDEILARNPCMKHKSGAACNKDSSCVVQNVGAFGQGGYPGYICVGDHYKDGGLGIGKNMGSCAQSLSTLQFPGYYDGCTTDGNRPIPYSGKNAITGCCTKGVDPGCI